MTLFTRSLWPDTVQAPYRRLVIALILAPLVLHAGEERAYAPEVQAIYAGGALGLE